MDIHVDQFGGHVEPKERDREAARQQQSAVGLAERVLQCPVANAAAIEKQVLQPVVPAAVVGIGDVAVQPDRFVGAADGD